jgi:predicted nucleic acid-binding protein
MAETPYLLDSNILLRWVKPDHSDYSAIVSATDTILRQDGILCYTSQNVAEFWNTCTRPLDRNGYGLSPQETDRKARFFEERLRLLPEGPEVHEEWRKLLVTHNVLGVQVHDARLVAAMRVHGVKRILTFNTKDFARFTDIEAVRPNVVPLG